MRVEGLRYFWALDQDSILQEPQIECMYDVGGH